MKKLFILIAFVLSCGICFNAQAEIVPEIAGKSTKSASSGEKIFLKHADECLDVVEKAAREISIQGVSMIAYIPGDETKSWISKMRVVDANVKGEYNLVGVAYCKAAEMALTLEDAGTQERESLIGELGYQGGVIVKVESGYLVAAFSGGSSEQDADVSRQGLEWLSKKF